MKDRWSQLSMSEKSDLMSLYIKNGISSLEEIKKHYNSFQTGGRLTFNEWKSQMQSKYPDIEMDNTKAGYDYIRYFNDNYEDAIKQLSELKHFPDTYKLPNHKTFSNESIYSRGPMMGGNWINDSTFSPSIINRQQYPNIYKENRPYTEREIYNSFATGGHLYQDGGPDDDKYSFLRREPEVAVADNTRYVRPISDVEIDRASGLPEGTTTMRRAMTIKTTPVISQNITPRETRDEINRAIKTQKVLEPINQALDVIENVPVVGDAVTVGRAASDATYGDYTAASLLPLMWLSNKIPFGKTGVKQAAKTAGVALKRKATTDPFVELLQQKTGRTITRVPIKQTRLGEIYSDGFSFVDDSGKEVAHIAGSRNRDNNVFVESSFMAPELRRRGLGKKMYFDFNNQTFDKYGTTLHSSPYQHQLTLETEPGSGVFISPSSNLWRGLKKNGLATMGGSGLNKYYVMASPVDEAFNKYWNQLQDTQQLKAPTVRVISEPSVEITKPIFKHSLTNYNPERYPFEISSPLGLTHTISGKDLAKIIEYSDGRLPAPSIAISSWDGIRTGRAPYPVRYDDGRYTFYFRPDYIDDMPHEAYEFDMFTPTYKNAETWAGRLLNPTEVVDTKRQMFNEFGTLLDLQRGYDLKGHKKLTDTNNYRLSQSLQEAVKALKKSPNRDYGEIMPLSFVDLRQAPLIVGEGSENPLVLDFLKRLNTHKITTPELFNIKGLALKNGGKLN